MIFVIRKAHKKEKKKHLSSCTSPLFKKQFKKSPIIFKLNPHFTLSNVLIIHKELDDLKEKFLCFPHLFLSIQWKPFQMLIPQGNTQLVFSAQFSSKEPKPFVLHQTVQNLLPVLDRFHQQMASLLSFFTFTWIHFKHSLLQSSFGLQYILSILNIQKTSKLSTRKLPGTPTPTLLSIYFYQMLSSPSFGSVSSSCI